MTFVNPVFSATNWVQIFDNAYMDTNSLRKEYRYGLSSGSYYSIWTKWLNDGSKIFIDTELQNKTKIWYYLSHIYFDCNSRLFDVKEVLAYDLNGNNIDDFIKSNSQISFFSVPPDSVIETLYDKACLYANGK